MSSTGTGWRTIATRVSADYEQRFVALCNERGKTRSQYVREIIDRELEQATTGDVVDVQESESARLALALRIADRMLSDLDPMDVEEALRAICEETGVTGAVASVAEQTLLKRTLPDGTPNGGSAHG